VRWRGAVASAIPPLSGDLSDRLGLMDRLGIDVAVLSSGTLDVGWAGAHAGAVARRINDRMAELCRAHPDRFRFLAAVPLDDRRALVGELDRAQGLGAVGAAITTTYGGQPLEAAEHRDFWREASARELVVLVHPCVPPGAPDPLPGSFLLAGFSGETTLAAARLVYAGVLEECPGARVIWSHVGGALPMLVARLDAGYRRFTTCPRPPSVYLARCYYDTVCAHGAALQCARDTFGAGALVFGTDEPHRLDLPEDIMATVRGRPWPAAELAAVLGGTAARLCPPGSLPAIA
jgi:aminocarboxymuconate-semialdehyde decarboxylase